jgi:putative oxidoreductase
VSVKGNAMLNVLDRYRDVGLLLLRVGIGLSYMGYGAPKLSGGPPIWEELGQAMRFLGITFAPTAWGSWPRCASSSAASRS